MNLHKEKRKLMDFSENAFNEVKSAASFCHQVAAWVTDMFCNFYFVKNYKIAYNATTPTAREKISTELKS